MNKFYCANGDLDKINIIEYFDETSEKLSLISYLIESDKTKNKVIELENKISELNKNIDSKINSKFYEIKKLLPFYNNNYSKIITGKSNDWMIDDNKNIYIGIEIKDKIGDSANIFTNIEEKINYNIKYNGSVTNIRNDGFIFNLIIDNLDTDYNDINYAKENLYLNYIGIG